MKYIILLFFLPTILLTQFPVNLNQNQISDPFHFDVAISQEYLLQINATSNTNWSQSNNESATLVVIIDNESDNYNQDIVLYAGEYSHVYNSSLGAMAEGAHTIQFKFDDSKSSLGASLIHIDSIELISIGTIDVDEDVFLHSPILYGRDLLSWNESTHTDIPMLIWHDINIEGENKRITYSIIFSNEDSRVGIGLADLLFSYGRTTDIEWMYEILLDASGNIVNEVFQGASHITTEFQGNKIDKHPILKNATLNCNFTDVGVSDYKFFPSPHLIQSPDHTREILMDENPWTYRIMAEELINENRYELPGNTETPDISDVRNYLYLEYEGSTSGQDIMLGIGITFFIGCNIYISHHNSDEFDSHYGGGLQRTSIELPSGFDASSIHQLGFISDGNGLYSINIEDILKLFYLNDEYEPVYIQIPSFSLPLTLLETEPDLWIDINDNLLNIDCMGLADGQAECDACNICNGNNEDMDDCDICFGNNQSMDCNNICSGPSTLDECGICDNISDNDNLTCSGCTDINAENYNEDAIIDNYSCTYSDNIFYVPEEYQTIQLAIDYSSSGDTVLVGPGIYYENIHFSGKALTVISQYETGLPISNFIISGVDSTSVVTIENIDGEGLSLIGFTITGGYGRGVSFEDFISLAANQIALDSLLNYSIRAGGISVSNANPILKDLHVTENTARNVGAGIGLINSEAIILSSEISYNNIPNGDALGGGGIAINGGHPYLNNVDIFYNTVGHNMYSLNGGGGILCGFPLNGNILQLTIEHSNIIGNIANIGAGVGVLSGNIVVSRLLIADNIGDYGSAISLGEPLGLAIENINMSISNSSFTSNSGLIGVGMINSANMNIINSIFWDNGEIEFSPLPNNNQLNVNMSYSLSEEIWPNENNLAQNPLFNGSENNNFTLQAGSPCIDAGTADIDGDGVDEITDYYGLAPDMGAFEYNPDLSNIEDIIPTTYALQSPYPNPFNPVTIISYEIPNKSYISIKVYDLLGREVTELLSRNVLQGYHTVNWDASNQASGVYFVKMVADGFTDNQKVVLVK